MKTLRDLMSADPITVDYTATVKDALELMQAHRIRHLPVVKGGELVAMLSDRDLRPVKRTLEIEGDAARMLYDPVSWYCSETLFGMDPDTPATTAIRTLRDFRVGAIPVWTHELVGIVTAEDLLDYLLEILEATG
ncbi:MAG: CBS domain-containing protein [Alphaproteobacteria bacterium]|nr:CBS domain-containing protein [Alphaproteobacteria bacterium]